MEDEILQVHLAIIGAGIYGIQAARSYLEVHPQHEVIILEETSKPGGVWSAERIYDDFYTQTPIGILEFSDQPMHDVPAEDQYYGFFRAKHVTQYLHDYLNDHEYAGVTLFNRILFNVTVIKITKADTIWLLHVQGNEEIISASKIIDATGLTSIPHVPDIPRISLFKGLVLHQKDFGKSNVLRNPVMKSFIVIGGGKSAADMAYSLAKAGKKVSWIIRRSGSGPAAFLPAKGHGIYRNSNESFYTRITGNFLMSWFTEDNRFCRFLHHTAVGQFMFQKIWKWIQNRSSQLADYDRPDGQRNGFHNLRPDTDVFWTNDSPGINQRHDFFDVVASKVYIYRQDICSMTEEGLSLSDGNMIVTDAIIFATGWKPVHPHVDSTLAAKLGLPVDIDFENKTGLEFWDKMDGLAAEQVQTRFPSLQNKPNFRSLEFTLTPFRLYNCMLPIADQSIVFLGKMMLGNHFRNAEVQSLYAVAVLDKKLYLPSQVEMEKKVAATVSWCKNRYLTKGQMGYWFYFDMVPYTDMLLKELGLTSHRKGHWKDLFEPCFAQDLSKLIGEYKMKFDIT